MAGASPTDQSRNEVLDGINALPEELQLPFALRFEHGMNSAEIAACLHITTQQAELAVNSAIDLLRPALEPYTV